MFSKKNKSTSSQFGFLAKMEFLQDWASFIIAKINPAVIHNLEKYHALKKVHYLSAIEDIDGDYIEFGVFTGSSFCHSLRCNRRLLYLNPKLKNTYFYGFDSFSGFGKLDNEDVHSFYTDQNFNTDFNKVNKRVKKVAKDTKYKLIPGYFSESLKDGAFTMGIKKSKIIFIDSDTYSSANEALDFCIPTIQIGTYIVLDDYFSYKGSLKKGVAGAFKKFLKITKAEVRQIFIYGMGGAVFVVSDINN